MLANQVCSAVGLAGRRCAVIATRKQISNDGSAERSYRPQLLWDVDDHITLVSAGLRSDVQYIADLSRRICMEHMYVCMSPSIVDHTYASFALNLTFSPCCSTRLPMDHSNAPPL